MPHQNWNLTITSSLYFVWEGIGQQKISWELSLAVALAAVQTPRVNNLSSTCHPHTPDSPQFFQLIKLPFRLCSYAWISFSDVNKNSCKIWGRSLQLFSSLLLEFTLVALMHPCIWSEQSLALQMLQVITKTTLHCSYTLQPAWHVASSASISMHKNQWGQESH